MSQNDFPETIAGYNVIKKLGRGSYSDVFLVSKPGKAQNPIALKKFVEPAATNAIEREIAALKIVSHYPPAPKLHEVVRHDGEIYLLMDYVDGEDVYDIIKRRGTFSEPQAFAFLREMLSELSFLHANNLLHTDIKITNVMQFHGRYCFIDFGLCRFNACVPTTSLTGGERYTAPEVFQGMRSRASDIYALGCVLYYCVTRRYPFDLNKKDPLEKKMHAAMYSSPDLSFSASKKVRYILSRMLEKDPMQRATITEIEAVIRGDLAIGRFAESGRDEPCPEGTAEVYHRLAEDRRRIVYAQYRYALLLEEGEQVAKNEAQAIAWFKTSALGGYALAQHRLGFLYYRGRCGLKKDYGRALYWFGKAAEQQYHRAEYYLGRLHELGRGVIANKQKAARFYRLAIANGDKAASKRLETLNHEKTAR